MPLEDSQVNIVQIITQTINNLFSNLFSSVDNSLYSILDDLLFVGPNLFNNSNLEKILGTFNSSGLILICNSFLLGFTLYYACFLMLSKFTLSQIQRPSQFIFKLFFCAIAINSSVFIIELFISIFSNTSLAIREVGEILFDESICLSTFIKKFNSSVYEELSDLNIFSLDGLMKSFVSVGLLNLAISYSIRYILIEVFIVFAPFAFISLVTPNTSWIFKSWIKLFISLLSLQILVSLILLISFSLEFDNTNTFSKFVYMGSIYALIKANSFIRDFMGGLSTDASLGFQNIKSIFSK